MRAARRLVLPLRQAESARDALARGAQTARRAISAAPVASASRRRFTRPGSTRSTTVAPSRRIDRSRRRPPRTTSPQWDEAATQAGFVRTLADGRHEVSLLLEGIHCGACIWLIERWLARRPGVAAADVNFATRRARVVFDPSLIAALRRAARGRRGRLSRVPVRSGAARGACAARVARAAAADGGRAARDDAGDDVRGADLRHGRRRRARAPAAARVGEPHADACPRSSIRRRRSSAARGATSGVRRPGMDVPVALGLAAAFAASAWSTFAGEGPVYYDSVTMFIALLLVARYVELVARRRAGDAVEAVARARPATAERLVDWPARRDVEAVAAAALAAGDMRARPRGRDGPGRRRGRRGHARASRKRSSPANRGRRAAARRRGARRQRRARRRARRARRCRRARRRASRRSSGSSRARRASGRASPASPIASPRGS